MNLNIHLLDLFTNLNWIFDAIGALLGLAIGLQAAGTITEILPGVLSGRWDKRDLWIDFKHRMIAWTGYYRR